MTTTRASVGRLRLLALLVPFATAGLLGAARGLVDQAPAALVLVLVVVALAAAGDRVAGVLAALSAALGFDVFLTTPYLSLVIARPADVELAVALVVVGSAVSELALRGRRATADSARREGYLDGLCDLLELPADTSPHQRGQALADAVARTLRAERAEWVDWAPDPRDRVVLPGEVLARGDEGPHELPAEGATAFPVDRDGRTVAHVRVIAASRVVRPTPEQWRVAALLVRVASDSAVDPPDR